MKDFNIFQNLISGSGLRERQGQKGRKRERKANFWKTPKYNLGDQILQLWCHDLGSNFYFAKF